MAADVFDPCAGPVSQNNGHVCLIAMGGRLYRCIRGRGDLWPHPEENRLGVVGADTRRDGQLHRKCRRTDCGLASRCLVSLLPQWVLSRWLYGRRRKIPVATSLE